MRISLPNMQLLQRSKLVTERVTHNQKKRYHYSACSRLFTSCLNEIGPVDRAYFFLHDLRISLVYYISLCEISV